MERKEKIELYRKIIPFLQETGMAVNEANQDKDNYIKYKIGKLGKVSSLVLNNMKILEVLEKLGFDMDELGTYLYKDLIEEVYQFLNKKPSEEEVNKLKLQLSDAFSSIYYYIAREWKEIGVKPFHLYIEKAIENISYDSIDQDLAKKIYNDELSDYGSRAFEIASYMSGYKKIEPILYNRPKINKLSNMPSNVKLKYISNL